MISLIVAADNIKVNTSNTLTSTSTTQPLSANQGKVLNEKVVQVETNLNAEAIQLLRSINPDLMFSGFVNTTTATPAHTANKAYIATESGTVLGVSGVVKGQIVVDDGSVFYVENASLKIEGKNYYYFISGFINSTGGVSSNAAYACTEFIPINSNLDLKLTGYENGIVKLYALYDSDKSLISVNPGTTGNQQTITLTSINLKAIETSLSKKIAFIRCSKNISQTTAEIFAANLPSLISYVNRINDHLS